MTMTIAEAGRKYGLTADTPRYYERIGLIPPVGRGAGGIRNYTEFDGDWIDFIKHMRNAGVRVEALMKYVALFQQGDATASARKQILVEQRAQIAARVGRYAKNAGSAGSKDRAIRKPHHARGEEIAAGRRHVALQ
ncbi:MAG: MerR family transcriptional regulator [Azoarcus sp.]|jgi:DNA-binding transcriptional MerR regulator|nr:MerR family transcriptional regulator [Azoarcus sp.]